MQDPHNPTYILDCFFSYLF